MSTAFVQKARGTDNRSSGSSIGVAFGSNVVSGNRLVACVWVGPASIHVASIADTRGSLWQLVDVIDYDPDASVEMWYAVAGGSGANTVTVTMNAGSIGDTWEVQLFEFSGTATSSVLDASGTALALGDPTINITLSGNDEVVVGAAFSKVADPATAGSGYTLGYATTTTYNEMSEYKVGASSGSNTVNFVNNATAFRIVAAAFSSSSGAVTVKRLLMLGCG